MAVRRERLTDKQRPEHPGLPRPASATSLLPNTAGCFNADDAIRTARLGRELLEGLDNPGAAG